VGYLDCEFRQEVAHQNDWYLSWFHTLHLAGTPAQKGEKRTHGGALLAWIFLRWTRRWPPKIKEIMGSYVVLPSLPDYVDPSPVRDYKEGFLVDKDFFDCENLGCYPIQQKFSLKNSGVYSWGHSFRYRLGGAFVMGDISRILMRWESSQRLRLYLDKSGSAISGSFLKSRKWKYSLILCVEYVFCPRLLLGRESQGGSRFWQL